MNDKVPPSSPAESDIQGEGDYRAAARYRKSAQEFVKTADVEQAAREAAPHSPAEADELEAAEAAGRARIAGGAHAEANAEPLRRDDDDLRGPKYRGARA